MDASTKVKICGIRRGADAALAVQLGARAIGFVFWPGSPRAIAPAAAREIVDDLPPFVAAVGVFVDQPRDEVIEIAGLARLTAVQLHGDEAPAAYADSALRVIKAVAVGAGFDPARLDLPANVTPLLDAHDPVRRGGTGQTIDWSLAAAVAATRPVILAGGLTPGNVRQAVERVQPYAIDVSSGVESAAGVKDAAKLRALFAALSA